MPKQALQRLKKIKTANAKTRSTEEKDLGVTHLKNTNVSVVAYFNIAVGIVSLLVAIVSQRAGDGDLKLEEKRLRWTTTSDSRRTALTGTRESDGRGEVSHRWSQDQKSKKLASNKTRQPFLYVVKITERI